MGFCVRLYVLFCMRLCAWGLCAFVYVIVRRTMYVSLVLYVFVCAGSVWGFCVSSGVCGSLCEMCPGGGVGFCMYLCVCRVLCAFVCDCASYNVRVSGFICICVCW